ncbi:hypothetical protein AVEN_65196-1 [Araneus ventricosus]|uniref:Uncharacterized protein n=1 Tax=Araneus ventricosus TaxID=182803 RepID=A0A4Y2AHA2_ARAVE|nr:hypothetical protein AVEN_65196-1 [Araneus ventricosus]
MHDAVSRKFLRHVCTCWLSLSRCLAKLVEQRNPLMSFLKVEIHNNGSSSTSGLRDYKIPKLNQSYFSLSRSEVGKKKRQRSVPGLKLDSNKTPSIGPVV